MAFPEDTIRAQAQKISGQIRAGMEMRAHALISIKDMLLLTVSAPEAIFSGDKRAAAYIDTMEKAGLNHAAFLTHAQPYRALFERAARQGGQCACMEENISAAANEFDTALRLGRIFLNSRGNENIALLRKVHTGNPRGDLAAMHDRLIVGAAGIYDCAIRRDALGQRLSYIFDEAVSNPSEISERKTALWSALKGLTQTELHDFRAFGKADRDSMQETLRDLRAFRVTYP